MKLLIAALAAVTLTGTALASPNLVANGGFETSTLSSNYQFGAGFGGQTVASWTGAGGNHLQFYYFNGTETTTSATNQFGDPKAYFRTNFVDSPEGKAFVALDGDSDYRGIISQTINGLTVGKSYTLKFSWAGSQLINRSGDTTDSLIVTFGTDAFTTPIVAVPSEGFKGWFTETTTFKATATSQVLSFLSAGTPQGLPPMAALDGVSLTGSVPEASTWALMLAGFGVVGIAARRRKVALAA